MTDFIHIKSLHLEQALIQLCLLGGKHGGAPYRTNTC
jgi:hypothetical protein